ncbi:Eco57I restriction-modification methylase domain-containing protein [Reichenbachiella sp.]|uniref:Eco57I restriction-modification methylase domain-containing protein n=1 Tax=Reichenbachiella sp. TaxID=2184521 RepID=UPI003BAE6975
MGLFQTSVLQKYLKAQDKEIAAKAYKKFVKFFHNPTIQQNIRESKEEQFQAGFLKELFGNVLGYKLNPEPNYNLTTEFKNEKGAKKADGAILKNGQAIAVIELKGTKTKDLESIRLQAFDYKANQSACIYVITSNFEKLRFYVNNAVEYEEFNLFDLTQERFELLFLCLYEVNVFGNVPLEIKESSIREEEIITKKFYTAYSLFKRELYRDLVKKNMKNEVFRAELNKGDQERANKNIKLALFKKSQKLIDRFLFIFFGEDRGLLPPNSTVQILNKWKADVDFGDERPLYEMFKSYFNYLDIGRQGTTSRKEIFAYNGGLFKPDGVLNSVIIDDELLYKHTHELSHYNFDSQIDVNILGHIFENSLNEIESVNAEIEGVAFDKQTTKRKKDGVFYTPKYITKYIVDNTIGKKCTEKKAELGVEEAEYLKSRKGRTAKKLKELQDQLETYREWLLSLTILDPACGSGAFLNQALDFLIKEHRYIDELNASLLGGSIVFQDIENTILENNIYGVDLNEESVEIAKLSLWLRTAQPRRKLTVLSSNIKCGNSLINNPKVAGDKAFNWQEEFPEVFEKGGFDVVIGNPPYVQSHSLNDIEKEYIYSNYKTSEYQINTYSIFIEKIFSVLDNNSLYSVIIPNYWLSTKYDSLLRKSVFLVNECIEVLNTYQVFEDATVDTVIITGRRTFSSKFPKMTKLRSIDYKLSTIDARLNAIDGQLWSFDGVNPFKSVNSDTLISFNEKFELKGEKTLSDFFIFKKGMQPYELGKGKPEQTREMMNDKIYHSKSKLDDSYLSLITARNVQRYYQNGDGGFIKYGSNLAAPRNPSIFQGPRVLINRILSKKSIDGYYTEEHMLINNTDIFNLLPKSSEVNVKALSVFVLHKICATFFKKKNINLNRAAFPKLNVNTLEKFPVPKMDKKTETTLSELSDRRHKQTNTFFASLIKFSKYLKSTFTLDKISSKIQNWHELDFDEFISELNKAIKKSGSEKLTKADEMDWMEFFETKKAEAQALKSEIDKTDKEIDRMVYELYRLNEEEIKIVEQ